MTNPELVTLIGTDAYIEAHADHYDTQHPGIGLGDMLRDIYQAGRRDGE